MNSVQQSHTVLVDSVANRYRTAGYEVVLEPNLSMVPFDLDGYHPDILATKGPLSLIIEVKNDAKRISFENLREVAEKTRLNDGWRFLLVTGQDVPGAELPDDPDQFSWQKIEEGMRNADKLRVMGQREAAYLVLWIAFEQSMRKLSFELGLPLDRQAPAVIIRQLYSQGELTMSQFDGALSCLKVRNSIVHGFRAPDIPESYERLREVLAGIFSERGEGVSSD